MLGFLLGLTRVFWRERGDWGTMFVGGVARSVRLIKRPKLDLVGVEGCSEEIELGGLVDEGSTTFLEGGACFGESILSRPFSWGFRRRAPALETLFASLAFSSLASGPREYPMDSRFFLLI